MNRWSEMAGGSLLLMRGRLALRQHVMIAGS
jgi:hypothetical protein